MELFDEFEFLLMHDKSTFRQFIYLFILNDSLCVVHFFALLFVVFIGLVCFLLNLIHAPRKPCTRSIMSENSRMVHRGDFKPISIAAEIRRIFYCCCCFATRRSNSFKQTQTLAI